MSLWNFDFSHSGIQFSVRHMVITKVHGRFTSWKGGLELDGDTLSSVHVDIDTASIDTNEPKRDAHLRSADFFDVEHHPVATFRSTRVEQLGGERFRLVGDLTIRGITREVVLDSEFGGRGKDPWGNEHVGFSARTTLPRKEWGLNWNAALETGGMLVGENVELSIEVEGTPAG